MTICALLLGRQFYDLEPSRALKYATLGLLFVNVSIGGTLTHFAAPPVLMVARTWGWDTPFMLGALRLARGVGDRRRRTLVYFAALPPRARRARRRAARSPTSSGRTKTPRRRRDAAAAGAGLGHGRPHAVHGVDGVHRALPGAVRRRVPVLPRLREGDGAVPEPHRSATPLLVGFFLAGLVIHGGLQGWWIAPVLASLSETPLFLGATVLTAFNDNALITYLATLVPNLSDR